MKKKLFIVVLAGTIFTMALLPALSLAGNGRMGGQGLRTQTKTILQLHQRQKLQDGSCLTAGPTGSNAMQKKGNTYGPGDGTGNLGVRPQDGTGYGAPSNR